MLIRAVTSMLIVTMASVAGATEYEITVDPASSAVSFDLKATMHTVHGTAGVLDGRILIDSATGVASGEVVVDAAGAATGNRSRDKKMHAKVLRTKEYPKIVLRAEQVTGDLNLHGNSRVTLIGAMELAGTEHPVRIMLEVEMSGGRVIADADFEVPYVAWGLKDPSNFALRVAKEVSVSVHLEGRAKAVQ